MMMAYGKDYEVSYIISINFRANLVAQNAGNCISGLQISNIFCGTMRPDPPRDSCVVCQPHGYPPLIYYLTERSLFKKCSPPPRKILKKVPDKISNKVVYVYCVSKAVGQTNTAPPPPQTRLGPYAQVVPCLPHLETLALIAETKFASRKAEIITIFPTKFRNI